MAAARDVAVVFLGLTDAEESEGFDRSHIDLAAGQLELLDAVLAVNPRVVVVLSHGAVVALPFADRVPAIVEAWLLTGAVNPSGRLAETIPLRLQDTPAYGSFPGAHGHVRYGEGLLVGYRWYDQREMAVAYPFGHGLSWDIRVDRWVVEPGAYRVEVAASSRDIRGAVSVELAGDEVRVPLSASSSIGEILAHPVAGPIVRAAVGVVDESMMKMMASFPIGRLAMFPGMGVSKEQVEQLIALDKG